MNEQFIYLLKVAAITSIFYACYQLFLKRDTFFKANRHFLLAGLLSAIALPFLVFTKVTYIERPIIETTTALITNANFQTATIPVQTEPQINWLSILTVVYVIGVLVMISRFLLQLFALRKLTKNKKTVKNGQFKLVTVDDEIAPFSFFKTIVYNPNLYSKEELDAIIEHEQVHCRQLHSIDMILSEVFLAFQWFNPFIWFYKRSIQQNLEFIADKEALETLNASKIYQQTLLKVSLGNYCTAVVNNFFNSLIKKRIIMINQQSSHKRNLFKMLFILPLLALFLYSFNVKEETKFQSSVNETSAVSFISPIAKSDLQNISSGFGMHKSPFTKKQEFHNGIDLVAIRGTEVLAAESGTVSFAKKDGKHGNRIIINHKGSYQTRYSHLLKYNIIAGNQVNKGDVIAYVGSTGLSTGPHLHFEVLKDGKLIDPVDVVAAFNKTQDTSSGKMKDLLLRVTANTTDSELDAIKNELLSKRGIELKTPRLKRNDKNQIIDVDFRISAKDGQKTRANFGGEPMDDIVVGVIKNTLILLKKNGGSYSMNDGQANSDFKEIRESVNNLLSKEKVIKTSSSNGAKRYITTGKEPRQLNTDEVVKGEIVSFELRKETTDKQLEEIMDIAKKNYDCTLKIEKLKRNEKGFITNIAFNFTNNGGTASSSQNNELGIVPFIFGLKGDSGVFIYKDFNAKDKSKWVLDFGVTVVEEIGGEAQEEVGNLDKLSLSNRRGTEMNSTKKNDWYYDVSIVKAEEIVEEQEMKEKEVEIEEKNEEKEIEVNEESEWKVSPGILIREVEFDEEKEANESYQIKTAAISKLKYEDGIDTDKYEFAFIIGKNSSDTYLDDMAKELKRTFSIDLKISKLKRNKDNEITSIKIALDDKKGNKSSAIFKKGDNPIPNIAVGKENDNLIIRSFSEENENTRTDYLYPSGQSFRIESEALHILDGKVIYETEFVKLDPTKIESVNVLKGKAATKLYGEKGKNGVIIVKSKKK